MCGFILGWQLWLNLSIFKLDWAAKVIIIIYHHRVIYFGAFCASYERKKQPRQQRVNVWLFEGQWRHHPQWAGLLISCIKTPRLCEAALEETRHRDRVTLNKQLIFPVSRLKFHFKLSQTESQTWRTLFYQTASKTVEEREIVSERWACSFIKSKRI